MSTPIINVSVTGNDIPSQQYKTVILKPNLVDDVNTITQAMLDIHGANTKYVVKYDFTLGEDIDVPNNCILTFDGGSIGRPSGSQYKLTGEVLSYIPTSGINNIEIINNLVCTYILLDSEITISNNISISNRIKAIKGGIIHCSSSYYVQFNGFDAGLFYCLDIDGNTRFLNIEKIYPQWFGECGTTDVDSTIAVKRALWACRSSIAGQRTNDATFGCSLVYFPRGYYLISSPVSMFAGTNIEGEGTLAMGYSVIAQKDYNNPAIYTHNKNYTLENTVLNRSNGEHTFRNIKFTTDSTEGQSDAGEPIIKYLSNAQTVELFEGTVTGDSVSENNYHDCHYYNCWFQASQYAAIGANDADNAFNADIYLHNCCFDICAIGIENLGKSTMSLHIFDTNFSECYFGSIRLNGGDNSAISIFNSNFDGCGTYNSGTEDRRASININHSKRAIIKNCNFRGLTNRGGHANITSGDISIDGCFFEHCRSTQPPQNIQVKANIISITNNIFKIDVTEGANPRLIVINSTLDMNCILSISNNIINISDNVNVEYVFYPQYAMNPKCWIISENQIIGTYSNLVHDRGKGIIIFEGNNFDNVKGLYANRPATAVPGQMYLCTDHVNNDAGGPIWKTDTGWVDASGTSV